MLALFRHYHHDSPLPSFFNYSSTSVLIHHALANHTLLGLSSSTFATPHYPTFPNLLSIHPFWCTL
ncbi:hypothetical protein BDZ97DRAFT_1804490, partial [Flammula alnicola]